MTKPNPLETKISHPLPTRPNPRDNPTHGQLEGVYARREAAGDTAAAFRRRMFPAVAQCQPQLVCRDQRTERRVGHVHNAQALLLVQRLFAIAAEFI